MAPARKKTRSGRAEIRVLRQDIADSCTWRIERGPNDAVRTERKSRDGTVVETPWSQRRSAVIVASERMTDEPWQHIEEGMLLRVDRAPSPRWRLVAA